MGSRDTKCNFQFESSFLENTHKITKSFMSSRLIFETKKDRRNKDKVRSARFEPLLWLGKLCLRLHAKETHKVTHVNNDTW